MQLEEGRKRQHKYTPEKRSKSKQNEKDEKYKLRQKLDHSKPAQRTEKKRKGRERRTIKDRRG